MTRPKTPTNILEMKGAFKKNPQRRRTEEPKPEKPLGNPPCRLSPGVKKIWREIARQCAPGVLTIMDRQAMELASIALDRVRQCVDTYDDEGRPLITMTDIRTAMTMLGKFGMTPSDRAGLGIIKK